METAQKLAEALGYGFRLVNDYFELGSYLIDENMEDAVGGLYCLRLAYIIVFDKGRQVKGKIGVLGPKKDMLGDDTRTRSKRCLPRCMRLGMALSVTLCLVAK